MSCSAGSGSVVAGGLLVPRCVPAAPHPSRVEGGRTCVDVWDVQLCVVLTGPGSGTCCPACAGAGAVPLWLSGAPDPLGYWVGPLPGGLGALGLLEPGSGARPMFGRLGPGGVGGLLPLVPYAYGGSFRGLPLQSSGWMRGCPCGGLPGSCAPLGLRVAWVFWPLCLLLIAGGIALYTYTLITKHGYHVGSVPWVLHDHDHDHAHTHTHTHTRTH